MKGLTPSKAKLINDKAKEFFGNYPAEKTCFATTDGTIYMTHEEESAKAHAGTGLLVTLTKGTDITGDDAEPVKKEEPKKPATPATEAPAADGKDK